MKPTLHARRPTPNTVTVDVRYPSGRHVRYNLRRMEYPSLWRAAYGAGMSTGRVLVLLRRAAAGCPGLGREVVEEGTSTAGAGARQRESDLHHHPGTAGGFAAELERLKGAP